MGRYAYFNTGFEYKFWFGVQDSSDITRFGGIGTMDKQDNPSHEWDSEDKDYVLQILRHFEEQNCIPTLNPDVYEKNSKGTLRLYSLLHGPIFEEYLSIEEQAYYALGWVIYHQLTYEPNLSCTYEP